jgi:hypothetical protein
MAAIWAKTHICHLMEDAAVNWLKTIARIRKRT